MYENLTYEMILQRMLDRIPNNYDKREGSVIWDALAPAAIELKLMYIEFDQIMDNSFADTARREFLIRRASEQGIVPYPASRAILQGVFTPETADVKGKRFNMPSNNINYIVTEMISPGVYQVECETTGTEGNKYFGRIIPIDYIDGLKMAELTELLIPGEDDEETEIFRRRYMDSFSSQAFGGNIADYKEKVNAISGVGGVKVYRAWNGGGTVKLVIIGSDYSAPSATLIDKVQTIMDPEQNHGEGLGLAPIDHIVTVFGVEEAVVDINTRITFDAGWKWADVKPKAEEIIDGYFFEISKEWANTNTMAIRISQIESRLLTLVGILDISDTTINGEDGNLFLSGDYIPIRGELNG